MAQKHFISPFRCLNTQPRSIFESKTRLLRRFAQVTHHHERIRTQYYATRRELQISTRKVDQPGMRLPFRSNRQAFQSYSIVRSQSRHFSCSPQLQHGDLTPPKAGEERHVTFIDKEGHEHRFEVADGDNLLDIAQANDLEMEGACGGSCACSTCHVIVQDDGYYDKMEEPSDDENDMLDLAFGLTETSRLGCQVQMSKDLDGIVVKLPSMTRNMQASDFEKKQ